jgi:hypothetical protein
MNLPQQQVLDGLIPDVRDILFNQLAELGDSVLAHSIEECLQRFKEDGEKYSSFNNCMPSEKSSELEQASVDQSPPAPC